MTTSPSPAITNLSEARRVKVRGELLAHIAGHVPEREDMRTYPGGQVWRRNRHHETMVLRVLRGRSFE